MFPSWRRFRDVDLFADRSEAITETLSQAIRAATSEEPDADSSVLFGQMKGNVVGLRYYTGVVSINQRHFNELHWHSHVLAKSVCLIIGSAI